MRKCAAALAAASSALAASTWVFSVLGWFPAPLIVALQAATPATLAAACIGVLAALLSSRPHLLRFSVVVLGVWLALVLDTRLSATPPEITGTSARIVAANMMLSNVEPTGAADDVLGLEPQVLVSVETPDPAMGVFARSGLDLVASGGDRARNVHIWSSYPAAARDPLVLNDRVLPVARIYLPGGAVTVVGVHLMSPTTEDTLAAWRRNWEMLAPALADLEAPVVVLGDFNTSLMHAPMRRELFRFDTASSASLSSLLTPTWPSQPYRWWSQPLQVLDLDHILLDGVAAASFSRHAVSGSDHLAVAAEIAPVPVRNS